ncbi:MAG: hypothetical protein LBT59_25230 [Clostridiales bacterium]|jgi:hypothetical protein|nr:hypothetical protein [Clostridiales bacterium]
MGLVKFKEITDAEYQSLDPRDPETLYFITDLHYICLDNRYYMGNDPKTGNTDSVTLQITDGLLGKFVFSSEEGNSLKYENGLWAPPEGIPLIEDPVEDNFAAVTSAGALRDSSYSLATAVSNAPGNYLPTAAAVYDVLNTLPLYWDATKVDLEGTSDAPTWKDYMSYVDIPGLVEDESFIYSNGIWVRFHFRIDVTSYDPERSKVYLPWTNTIFPLIYQYNEPYGDGGSFYGLTPTLAGALTPEFVDGADYVNLRFNDFTSLFEDSLHIRVHVSGFFPVSPFPAA